MVVKIIIGVVLLIFSILLALGGKKNCDEVDTIIGILCAIGSVIVFIGILTGAL